MPYQPIKCVGDLLDQSSRTINLNFGQGWATFSINPAVAPVNFMLAPMAQPWPLGWSVPYQHSAML